MSVLQLNFFIKTEFFHFDLSLRHLFTQEQHFQCFPTFQQNSCGANCGANEKSSYKKVDKNLLVTA